MRCYPVDISAHLCKRILGRRLVHLAPSVSALVTVALLVLIGFEVGSRYLQPRVPLFEVLYASTLVSAGLLLSASLLYLLYGVGTRLHAHEVQQLLSLCNLDPAEKLYLEILYLLLQAGKREAHPFDPAYILRLLNRLLSRYYALQKYERFLTQVLQEGGMASADYRLPALNPKVESLLKETLELICIQKEQLCSLLSVYFVLLMQANLWPENFLPERLQKLEQNLKPLRGLTAPEEFERSLQEALEETRLPIPQASVPSSTPSEEPKPLAPPA